MAEHVAIGYPDEATAARAAEEARRLASDLIIQPEAITVISEVGPELDTLLERLASRGVDEHFVAQVRELLQPGTSALFLTVDSVTPDRAVDALAPFGGTVVRGSVLSVGSRP